MFVSTGSTQHVQLTRWRMRRHRVGGGMTCRHGCWRGHVWVAGILWRNVRWYRSCSTSHAKLGTQCVARGRWWSRILGIYACARSVLACPFVARCLEIVVGWGFVGAGCHSIYCAAVSAAGACSLWFVRPSPHLRPVALIGHQRPPQMTRRA